MFPSNIRKLILKVGELREREYHLPEEFSLTWGAVWYIFSEERGSWRMNARWLIRVINQTESEGFGEQPLSDKQKLLFTEYLEPFRDIAIKHGLLTDYDMVVRNITYRGSYTHIFRILDNLFKIAWLIAPFSLGYFTGFITSISGLVFWIAGFLWIGFWLTWNGEHYKKLSLLEEEGRGLKEQNDIILQGLNKDIIASDAIHYKAGLVISGWIYSSLPESFLKGLREISKKYWKDYEVRDSDQETTLPVLAEVLNKALKIIKNGKYNLESLIKILSDVDVIIDNPFMDEIASKRLEQIRMNFIDKLKGFKQDADFMVLFDDAEKINAVYRKTHFDVDRVFAYKIFFDQRHGDFIQQLIDWSVSENSIEKIGKFTSLNSIELEALSHFLDNPIIFEFLAKQCVQKAFITEKVHNSSIQKYIKQRLSFLYKTIEGRRQIINDLSLLHNIQIIYMKIMLDIIQKDRSEIERSYRDELVNQATCLMQEFVNNIEH